MYITLTRLLLVFMSLLARSNAPGAAMGCVRLKLIFVFIGLYWQSKSLTMFLLPALVLVNLCSVFQSVHGDAKNPVQPAVTYGSVIRLTHKPSASQYVLIYQGVCFFSS